MATFFTAAEDSQREVNYFTYEQNEEEKQDYKEYWRNANRTKINKET